MAAEVDICNLALAHLGDEALVTCIAPPDGSAQSSHCARFYPIARDALLEMHPWGFATERVALAAVANASSTWLYAYAAPSGALNYLEVLDPAATDEYSVGVIGSPPGTTRTGVGVYSPQPFEVEADSVGNDIIYSNVADAVIRYTKVVTDTTKFSPLFVTALVHLLASMLSGPVLKGQVGRDEAKEQLKMFGAMFEKASESDANQRRLNVTPGAPWMVNR